MGFQIEAQPDVTAMLTDSLEEISSMFEETEVKNMSDREIGEKRKTEDRFLTRVRFWANKLSDMPNSDVIARILRRIRKAIRQTSGGSYLALDPSQVRKLMESIKNTIGDMRKLKLKPVMLVSVDIRRYLRKIIESEYAELPVLSYQELSKEINIQPLGRIS